MQTQNYNLQDELDEELTIDLKKIFFAIWSRKELIIKVFVSVLIFFILLTFVCAKKYTVKADLYVNKSNNSNMVDINPYFISELGAGGGMSALMSGGGSLVNELELIKSPLVIDKVIRDNNFVIKKKYGFLPNKKEGEYISASSFLKKNISIENKKGTNVISITYTNKKPDVAYNVVNSLINNYIALHKELNSEKAKFDKEVLENNYNQAKEELKNKVNSVSGIPEQALSSTSGISVMSAFSNSAASAMSTLKGQLIQGQKSRIEVTEQAAKVAELSKKYEWAKLVYEMADTSKVIVLKEPQKLRDFEYSSPKLLINIILGIVFGFIASLIAVIYKELTDSKLSYSMLGDNIIYNLKKEFSDFRLNLFTKQKENIGLIVFEPVTIDLDEKLSEFKNINLIKAAISQEFINEISKYDSVMLLSKINQTNAKEYKQVKQLLQNINKNIINEVLL